MAECSIEYYDSAESCDYSGYSHDYHCSKCSKMRAIDESELAASFRANDRLKLVDAEYLRLCNMTDIEISTQFKLVFQTRSACSDRCKNIKRLMWDYVRRNKPAAKYRAALEIYNSETLKWKIDTKTEPDLEDVITNIINSLHTLNFNEKTLESNLKLALKNATRKHKLVHVQKLLNLQTGLLSEKARNFYDRCVNLIFVG